MYSYGVSCQQLRIMQQTGRRHPSHISWPLLHFLVRASESLIRQSRLPFLPWPFRIRTMAIMVFQFRVVAGAPNSLSIWPRYPIVFMWRRYTPKTNRFFDAISRTNHSPDGGSVHGMEARPRSAFDRMLTKRTISGREGSVPNGFSASR